MARKEQPPSTSWMVRLRRLTESRTNRQINPSSLAAASRSSAHLAFFVWLADQQAINAR